jgi:hypothetical protein
VNFEAHLVPKKSTNSPAFIVGHDEENDDRAGSDASEQSKRKHRTGHELRQHDGWRPEFSPVVELIRKFGQMVRQRAPGEGNIPIALRSPCGINVIPTTARNSISAQGKSA